VRRGEEEENTVEKNLEKLKSRKQENLKYKEKERKTKGFKNITQG
jgi:hypothetical protein